MNWLDWVIIVVVVLSAWNGLRRGLILSLAKAAGFLVGLLVAFVYYRQLADYAITHWRLDELAAPVCAPLLSHWRPVAEIMTVIPDNQLLEQLNILIAGNVISCASFLILLMITACLMGALGKLLTKMAELSLLGSVNRLGGLLFGILFGLLYVAAILLVLAPFQHLNLALAQTGNSLWSLFPPGRAFEGSVLVKYFQPFLELLMIKTPLNIPPIEILPDSIRDINI